MLQIAYMSRASHANTLDDLRAMHQAAADYNASEGITGLLVYDGRRFLQVLEGPADPTRQLMERIARDSRHTAVTLLLDRPIEAHQFERWSLAGIGFDRRLTPSALLAEVKEIVRFVTSPELQAAFIGFAKLAR